MNSQCFHRANQQSFLQFIFILIKFILNHLIFSLETTESHFMYFVFLHFLVYHPVLNFTGLLHNLFILLNCLMETDFSSQFNSTDEMFLSFYEVKKKSFSSFQSLMNGFPL
jgi:hypothetical protein